jgi:hypothetical protein
MQTNVNDGRVLEEEEEHVPFFSLRVRLPSLFDLAAFVVIGGGCALFYQSYITGSYGLMAHRVIQVERDLLRGQDAVLDRRIAEQLNLNRRLSDDFLDLDLLEERSRKILGYTHSMDVSAQD